MCGGAYGASTHFAADPWLISGPGHRSGGFAALWLRGKAGLGYTIAGDEAALQHGIVGAGFADRCLRFAAVTWPRSQRSLCDRVDECARSRAACPRVRCWLDLSGIERGGDRAAVSVPGCGSGAATRGGHKVIRLARGPSLRGGSGLLMGRSFRLSAPPAFVCGRHVGPVANHPIRLDFLELPDDVVEASGVRVNISGGRWRWVLARDSHYWEARRRASLSILIRLPTAYPLTPYRGGE